MGFRFSRRISLFPGLTLNLSGSGVSVTVGVPGANFNISQRGIYGTAGIPGSGLRYRTQMMKFPSENPSQEGFEQHLPLSPEFTPYSFERAGQSFKSQEGDLTSFNLRALKAMIFDHRNQLAEAKVNVAKLNAELAKEKRKRLLLMLLSLGFLFAERRARVADNISDIEENIAFESELASSGGIKFALPPGTAVEQIWNEFTGIFRDLAGSQFIWDISRILENDLSFRRTTRSNAANSYDRNRVNFVLSESGIFETEIAVPLLGNFNGAQMMLHPGFLHIQQGQDGISLIDFQQIEVDLIRIRFVEEEAVPSDANVVSQVWAKANKDGSPDLRFNQNYQIPVCEYAEVTLSTLTGLNEKYLVSNVMAAERFVSAFKALKARFKHDLSFFAENDSATIAGPAETGSKDDAGIEPSAATLLDIHGGKPSGDRTLEDITSQLAELQMHIATLMLAAARVSFSEEQRKVLFNRGEENVLDQMVAQLPKEVKVGADVDFDIRVDYTDGDGNFIPNVKLRLSYCE